MSQKTYLQLVNKVLLNLREAQVTDLSADYSLLIGEFINQAKEKVEDAWRWKALSVQLSWSTVAGQTAYNLEAAGSSPVITSSTSRFANERSYVLTDMNGNHMAFDATDVASGGLIYLNRVAREDEFHDNLYLVNQPNSQPYQFSYSWENGHALFSIYSPPLGSRAIKTRFCIPQDDFTAVSDTLLVPWRPVVSWATFIALEERGEELSERSSLYKDRFDQELQRAIETDQKGEPDYMQLTND